MKTMKLFLLLAATLTSLSSLAEIRPEEGNERGNGGDEYSKEFVRVAYDVLESLAKDPIAGVDNKALLAAIQKTKVNSRDSLTLRGNEVDAINFPDAADPRILMSRAGWNRMKAERHRRAFLALHEYLAIMGVDDSSYQVSIQLDRASVCERNSVARQWIEIAVKKFCYRITAEDLHFVDGIQTFGNWLDEGEGVDLQERDLEGLSRLVTFSFYAPTARVHANAFDAVPNLNYVNLRAPDRLDRLNFHPRLSSVSVNGDFEREFAIQNIADAAFSQLPRLRFLGLMLDAARVNLTRATAGVTSLTNLNLNFLNGEQVPAEVMQLVKRNPGLTVVGLGILGGKIGPVQAQMEALGFKCTRSDNSIPGAGGERLDCRKEQR